MTVSQAGTGSKTLPLSVSNTGFMLDRLGMDCAPLQFLRELTQNSIEAILRTPSKRGEVIWDVDWITFDLEVIYKLSVSDNGDGMNGEEMVKYINHLSSSVNIQSHFSNFGVGAKIAAATRNHAGLVYLSWKDNIGSMVHLWRDPETAEYGLQQLDRPDGSFGHWAHVDDAVKPEAIESHGTKVILLGHSLEQNTMAAPEGAPSPSRWVTRYLNTRYFQFPEGIAVRAREGWENDRSDKDRNLLRTLTGQRRYLETHAFAAGEVKLNNAVAYWWILKDEGALTQNSGFVASSGHCAALWKDELYEMTTGRANTAMLQGFGIVFGYNQVVVYVEPKPADGWEITTNTARTQLLINSQPLPWSDWAEEFRQAIPEEIVAHMEAVSAASKASDHTDSIKERLRQIEELFRLSRYRPIKAGALRIDPESVGPGGQPRKADTSGDVASRAASGSKGGKAGSVYSLFLADEGVPGVEVKPDIFPTVRWISVADGTRTAGDMEDRAARYLAPQNLLLINADFRVFTDMVKRWAAAYAGVPGAQAKIEEIVREWFEQSLVETVISSNSLRDAQHWSVDHIDKVLSEEGLTASVLPRWHIEQSIKRSLGTKLGSLKTRVA